MKRKFGPRIRGELIPFAIDPWQRTVTTTYKNQPTVVATGSGFNVAPQDSANGDRMYDIVTRNFKKLQSRGVIINNHMSKSHAWSEVIDALDGESSYGYTTNPSPPTGAPTSESRVYSGLVSGGYSNFPLIERLDLDYVKREAINGAYANAHQRNVLGIVDVLEAGKTLNMIRTNLGRLESVVSDGLYRTATKSAKRMKKNSKVFQYKSKTSLGYVADASGLLLEVNYGVIPLMLSLQGLVKTLTKDYVDTNRMKWPPTFRGSESSQKFEEAENVVNVVSGGYDSGANTTVNRFKLVLSQNCYARAGVMTRYNPSRKSQLGLDLRDLIPGAYELIPFSFVIDWALNINSYLEAVTPVPGFATNATWVTLYNEVVLQYIFNQEAATLINTPGKWKTQNRAYTTQVVTGWRTTDRIPGVVPLPPKFNSELKSLTHFISGAALAFSKVTSSKTFRKSLTK
jgi:hypothetical protein